MRILLTESETGASARVERELRAAGYDVVLCRPALDAGDACVVFTGHGECPLRTLPVDLLVDVRGREGPQTARELGAACAIRNGVPLIVAGPSDPERFPWSQATAVCSVDDVVETCEAALSPVDVRVARDVARVAQQQLEACGVDARATVSIAEGGGDTAIFVAVPAALTAAIRKEIEAAVRLAVAGRKDFPEHPRIMVAGGR